jgi:hypothetical protein
MATSSKEIINYIEKNHPIVALQAIVNCSDQNIEQKSGVYRQYIIGVTDPNKEGSVNLRWYEHRMKENLPAHKDNLHILGWPFEAYEIDDVEQVLKDLAAYLSVKLDIKDMMIKAEKFKSGYIYIVITVLEIPMITAG